MYEKSIVGGAGVAGGGALAVTGFPVLTASIIGVVLVLVGLAFLRLLPKKNRD